MNIKYSYAREKLGAAIHLLATGPGDVRERLCTAYGEFHPLNEGHFPEELQEDWKWVHQQLTRFGPKENFEGKVYWGAVDHTLTRIKNSTGSKIANRIYELNWKLRELDYE